ncbi:Uncharacterised protein [uncultured Clostridium sp.]|nr:Uncharacterised protein [uncultured Clostridium sp.]
MRRKVAVLLTAVCMLFTACSPSTAGGDRLARTTEEDQANDAAAANNTEEPSAENRADAAAADDTDKMFRISGIHETDARDMFRKFVGHITADEKEEASAMIRFPRKIVFSDREIEVQDAEQFLDYYDQVFTEDFKERLSRDLDGELFGNYMGVALGNGEVWLMSSEGTIRVETINNGGECSVLYPGEPGVQPE